MECRDRGGSGGPWLPQSHPVYQCTTQFLRASALYLCARLVRDGMNILYTRSMPVSGLARAWVIWMWYRHNNQKCELLFFHLKIIIVTIQLEWVYNQVHMAITEDLWILKRSNLAAPKPPGHFYVIATLIPLPNIGIRMTVATIVHSSLQGLVTTPTSCNLAEIYTFLTLPSQWLPTTIVWGTYTAKKVHVYLNRLLIMVVWVESQHLALK